MGLVLSDTEVSMFAVFTSFALRARSTLSTALAALALSACDDAPDGAAPSISELSYAPDEAPVASPFQVTGQLDFTDPDGDLVAIVFQITAPDGTPSAPSRSKLSGTDGLTAASLQITFTAIAPAAGDYGFEVWLEDAAGHTSNRLTGLVTAR
jgi:hypothetical protein